MRSRYTAFVVGDRAYLAESWHPRTRPDDVEVDPALRWTGLEILATEDGGEADERGLVEFRSSWEGDSAYGALERGVMHERSRFRRVRGRWCYLDGDLSED